MDSVVGYAIQVTATGVEKFDQASAGATRFSAATQAATSSTTAIGQASTASASSVASFSTRMSTAGASIAQVGQTALVTATAIAGAVTGPVLLANSYERSFSKITGLVGIARDEVAKMETSTLKLAGRTAQAPVDLANAMFTVTSAGLRGASATAALATAAELAAGGMGDARTIAQAMTSTLQAYASAGVTAAEAGDFLAATARAGNFEASQLAGSLGRVLPVSSQLGISLGDVGGSIALLTRTSGNATDAITQVAALMRALMVPSEQAGKILAEAGVSMQQVRDVAAGPEGLVGALRLLQTATGGNSEMLAKMLGSSEAVLAAFGILNASAGSLDETFGAVTNSAGVAAETFSAAAETGSFKFEQALVRLKIAAIEVGGAVGPGVASALEGFSTKAATVAAVFTSMPEPIQHTVVGLGQFAAVAGVSAVAVGKTMAAVGGLSDVLGRINVTGLLAMNPALVAAGAAAAVLVAAYVAVAAKNEIANQRAEVYTEAITEATGINTDFSAILGTTTDRLNEQAAALGGAADAAADLSPEARALAAVLDELGETERAQQLSQLGVSMEDLNRVITGKGPEAEEATRKLAAAIGELEEVGVSFNSSEFLTALEQGRKAGDLSAETMNRAARAALNLGIEEGILSKREVELTIAMNQQAGQTLATANAADTLFGRYEAGQAVLLATNSLFVAGAAAGELQATTWRTNTAAIAGNHQALSGLAGMQQEEIDKLSDVEKAVMSLNVELRAQYFNTTQLAALAADYRGALDGVKAAQRDLDAATESAARATEDLKEAQNVGDFRRIAAVFQDVGFKLAGVGSSAAEVTRYLADNEQQLRDVMRQAGLTSSEIETLIDDYLRIPRDILTKITAQADSRAARADLVELTNVYRQADIAVVVSEGDVRSVEARLAELARSRAVTISPIYGAADTGSLPPVAPPKAPIIGPGGVDIAALYHDGGYVTRNGPKWTPKPLASDEVVAVLQLGEFVVDKPSVDRSRHRPGGDLASVLAARSTVEPAFRRAPASPFGGTRAASITVGDINLGGVAVSGAGDPEMVARRVADLVADRVTETVVRELVTLAR